MVVLTCFLSLFEKKKKKSTLIRVCACCIPAFPSVALGGAGCRLHAAPQGSFLKARFLPSCRLPGCLNAANQSLRGLISIETVEVFQALDDRPSV